MLAREEIEVLPALTVADELAVSGLLMERGVDGSDFWVNTEVERSLTTTPTDTVFLQSRTRHRDKLSNVTPVQMTLAY